MITNRLSYGKNSPKRHPKGPQSERQKAPRKIGLFQARYNSGELGLQDPINLRRRQVIVLVFVKMLASDRDKGRGR